jgi:hypothetical protein
MRISGFHELGTLVNPKNYLFFQWDYERFSCPSTSKNTISGLEVLCDTDHFGRMYVSGMFVMEAPKLEGMGLNYVGHGHSYKVLGLTDERNSCHVEVLIKEIPTLLEHIKKTETKERVDGFVTSLAKMLQEEPESDIRYLADFLGQPWYVPAAIKALAADLLGVFQSVHGANAIPTCKTEVSQPYSFRFLYLEMSSIEEGPSLYIDLYRWAEVS